MRYEDRDGEIVEVPLGEVLGEKKNVDGSLRFKLLGGPYHDMQIRSYYPHDEVVFPSGDVYELTPPFNLKRSKKWKFVHNMERSLENQNGR